ncbi:unnamed protein product [Amoebophrya sp. A120]|nr:unnamed protein product [Amoebophrya sp. A120]
MLPRWPLFISTPPTLAKKSVEVERSDYVRSSERAKRTDYGRRTAQEQRPRLCAKEWETASLSG